ncbi:hypothetical protein J2Z31_001801 [Sinorhizobium kostiense]|uniref:Uncharacterized protein n=1 Tax=Sinorhizobium kostiense TaxID=76747 RepID=A0ABS4QXV1_9HYPH|nr:hypothetical protein [Sinorhizobium kostiense]MBP2235309.1 hypothetical protein [Sinorhizobium kostiense]
MKYWMTSVAMTVAIFANVVVIILAMTALALLTFHIVSLVRYDEIAREELVILLLIWLILASYLVGGFTLFASKDRPWRRGALAASTTCLLLGVLGAGVAVYVQGTREYRPINTAAEARPWLERLLKRWARSFPDAYRIVDLDGQIRNIRVHGPSMSFDPETARYIEFEFDTGCGEVIRLTAMTGGEGTELWPIKELLPKRCGLPSTH